MTWLSAGPADQLGIDLADFIDHQHVVLEHRGAESSGTPELARARSTQ